MVRLRRHLGQAMGLALVLSLMAGRTRAELITMTITDSSGPFSVDIFATAGATTYNVGGAGLGEINDVLAAQGSEYQIFSLSGSSSFPGIATQGSLSLTGVIHSVAGGGPDSFLQIMESESGFTSPAGVPGTLLSGSTGIFTNEPAGGGHTATSSFNAVSIPSYSVLSTGAVLNPAANSGSVGIPSISMPYSLANTITFDLAPASSSDVIDTFAVAATVTSVPEPSSVVLLALGVAPVVFLIEIGRRRVRVAH
jgi:hypothetical protein